MHLLDISQSHLPQQIISLAGKENDMEWESSDKRIVVFAKKMSINKMLVEFYCVLDVPIPINIGIIFYAKMQHTVH